MVRELKEATKRRMIWRAMSDAFNAKCDGDNEALDMVLKASRLAKDLDTDKRKPPQPIYQMLSEFKEYMDDCVKGVRTKTYSTGFWAVDEYYKYTPQCLYIVGARPAMGKTAWAMSQAAALSSEGLRGLFVSIEMSNKQISQRLVSSKTGIKGFILRDGDKLEESDVARVAEFIEEYRNVDLDFVDVNIHKIDDIRYWLDAKEYDYVIIDYLQLLGADDNTQSREQIVGDNSWKLKLIAKEYDMPVIALAQLSRSLNARQDKRPTLADLRDSGRIEQDADVVTFIHRPEYYDSEVTATKVDMYGCRSFDAELIVAKNRHGGTGTAIVGWRPDRTVFTNLSREEVQRDF